MAPPFRTLELKRAEVSAKGEFSGIASAFGVIDRAGDQIEFGAFRQTISFLRSQGSSLPLLWQHDQSDPIGAVETLDERDDGLHITGRLFMQLENARTAFELMKSGAAYLSIGFNVLKSEPLRSGGIRILEIDLGEISVVSTPANPFARVTSVKSQILESPVALEKAARELLGLSNREAKRLARGGWAELTHTDPERLAIESALTRIADLEV